MSQTIYKYPLSITDNIGIEMPANAKPLTVQMQKGIACMWCLVDGDEEKVIRSFEVVGTGHDMKQLPAGRTRSYIGTFQLFDGSLVFHVFETLN